MNHHRLHTQTSRGLSSRLAGEKNAIIRFKRKLNPLGPKRRPPFFPVQSRTDGSRRELVPDDDDDDDDGVKALGKAWWAVAGICGQVLIRVGEAATLKKCLIRVAYVRCGLSYLGTT